jgi:antitoxin (DNA-binding transcriptional repressor) of toxin-antitoxin stability system
MATLVSTYEAKAHLSRLLAKIEKTGRPITICRNRKPVADLVAHRSVADPLRQDPALKGARFHGDPCRLVGEADWPAELR